MPRLCIIVVATLLGSVPLASGRALAESFFVAPDGSDMQAGTEAQPFASVAQAQARAAPGDTVLIRGGRYVFSGTAPGSEVGILFDRSGRQGAPIRYWAYQDEVPVFDFSELQPRARIRGFRVTGSWLHFRGLELVGVQQILVDQNESWAIRLESGASNNIFERLDLHHHEGPGLFIADGGDNLVLNVDSHHNYDPDRGGENADGFGCHSNDGGNVFRGCRAWYNSDDGFDFINSPGACVVEYSWAFKNGYRPDSMTVAGNGAGIKGGGFTNNVPATIPRHVIRFNLAWQNRRQGFYANHHEGGLDWFHNTAFDNGQSNFDMLADEGRAEHLLRNNLAFGSGGTLGRANAGEIDSASNSWDLGPAVTAGDFQSLSDMGADGPRQADGSLPALPFLRLAGGSALIDRGQALSFTYEGSAPDIGAYESGLVVDGPEAEPESTDPADAPAPADGQPSDGVPADAEGPAPGPAPADNTPPDAMLPERPGDDLSGQGPEVGPMTAVQPPADTSPARDGSLAGAGGGPMVVVAGPRAVSQDRRQLVAGAGDCDCALATPPAARGASWGAGLCAGLAACLWRLAGRARRARRRR